MRGQVAELGEMVLLLAPDGKRILQKLAPGQQVHTHLGYIRHEAIAGKPFGSILHTQLEQPYVLLKPSTLDLVMHSKRQSQIIYPKEIGYILLKMNIVPGSRVVEAGTGSGGLTLCLARAVQPNGRVYSYEEREDMQRIARLNLERARALDAVEFKVRDIRAGFDEHDADALFLDVREPWLFLAQAHAALVPGGFFGSLVPTVNQVSEMLAEMERMGNWIEIEVSEILHRLYKTNAERLRPTDRMVAHTGYLIFARPVTEQVQPVRTRREQKYLRRESAASKMRELPSGPDVEDTTSSLDGGDNSSEQEEEKDEE